MIEAPSQKVCDALVDPSAIQKYFMGATVKTDWKIGSPITWSGDWKGTPFEDMGEILVCDSGKALSYCHWSPLAGTTDSGRLAGSPHVAPLAQIDNHQWSVHDYLHGRVENQVVAMLRDDALWAHPLLAGAFGGGLRDRMLDAVSQLPACFEELAAAPHVVGHGDACPNNLLGTDHRDAFVLIDFGFWKPLPLGFDLGQLLLGDVQIGRRSADDLNIIDACIIPAYISGLIDEGYAIEPARLARLHALQMMVFTGISSMPFEHLNAPLSPELQQLAETRAAITTYCLNRIDATHAPT